MRKLIISAITILILVASLYFINTTYFFNKYLAPNIEKYNFSYKSVDGNLFGGFRIVDLRYRGMPLSSEVELKFNPLKLIDKTISISKLLLLEVNKSVLERLIKDFKSDDSSNSNSKLNIDLNFELKRVTLNFRPFRFKEIIVSKNSLDVEHILFKNNNLVVGNTTFFFSTNFGKIYFSGEFLNRVLTIDNINIKDLDVKKLLKVAEDFKVSREQEIKQDSNQSTKNTASSILPLKIYIKRGFLSLKPFKLEGVSSKDLKIEVHGAEVDLNKTRLKRLSLKIKYKSNLADILLKGAYKYGVLNISDFSATILKPEALIKIAQQSQQGKKTKIEKKSDIDSKSDSKFIDIKRVNIGNVNIRSNSFKYKKDKLENLHIFSKNISINLNKKSFMARDIYLKIYSTLLDLELTGAISKNIILDNLNLNLKNGIRLLSYLKALPNKKSSKKELSKNREKSNGFKLPESLYLKRGNLTIRKIQFGKFKINNALVDILKLSSKNLKDIDSADLKIYLDSNFGELLTDGVLKKDKYFAKGTLKPDRKLAKLYNLPLKIENIKPLKFKGYAGLKDLKLNIRLSGKDILTTLKGLSILNSNNIIYYNYKSGLFKWKIKGSIDAPYIKRAKLENLLTYEKGLTYQGILIPKEIPPYLKKPPLFNNLKIGFKGDTKRTTVDILTDYLKGNLKTNFKIGNLKITNRTAIPVSKITKLPKKLKGAKITFLDIKTPLNFKKILPLKGSLNLKSNLVNLKGNFIYNDTFKTKLYSQIARNSLLYRFKNIKFKSLFPLNLDLEKGRLLTVDIKNRLLTIGAFIEGEQVKGILRLGGSDLMADGTLSDLSLRLQSQNISLTLKDISKIYKISNLPDIRGELNMRARVKKGGVDFSIESPYVIYEPNNSNLKIEDITLKGSFKNTILTLNNYSLKVKEYSLYSTKISRLIFNRDFSSLNINKFWLNNSLSVTGKYSIKRKRGSLLVKANSFKVKNKDFKVNLRLNNRVNLNGDKTSISGVVTVLSAVVKKSIKPKSIDNEDIIIVEDRAKKKSSKFTKDIKLNLLINSKRAIVYKDSDAYFLIYPDIKVIKNYNSLTLLKGKVVIGKKSYYKLNGKKLRVSNGLITFKGKSSTPYLNITLTYRGKEYLVRIHVSGTPSRPVLYFSSTPPLTENQILAYLLFEDEGAIGTHSQESMLNLIGSSIAKTFLGSIGVKLDHISIKRNGFSIGKNITDNVTIYYNQDGDKASVKTRIDLKKSVYTEIEVGSESQSADIIFSKEY